MTDAADVASVKEALDHMLNAYVRGDLDAVRRSFLPDASLALIGTGADERATCVDEAMKLFERDASQADKVSVETDWYAVGVEGDVAWTAGDARYHVMIEGQEHVFELRNTCVLVRRQGQWLVVQSHASLPAAGQAEGRSYPAEA